MRTSKEITEISKSFLKAQMKMEKPDKNSKNPFFKSNYADLDSVLNASRKYLHEEGIAILQPTVGKYVQTILLHESGQWFMGKTEIKNAKPNDPQAQGSGITYARRYGLQSMLGLGGDDDDGESAMDRESKPKKVIKEDIGINQKGVCSGCGAEVSEKVESFSKGKYGKILCMDCQGLQ